MKVRDLIIALTACPMDDDIAVRLVVGDDFRDIGCSGVRCINDDHPLSTIDLEEDPILTAEIKFL